jgi:hypothetical protein
MDWSCGTYHPAHFPNFLSLGVVDQKSFGSFQFAHTFTDILFGLRSKRPIEVELRCRTSSFLLVCINSENTIVNSLCTNALVRNVSTRSSSASSLAKNYVSCCKSFETNVMIPEFYRNFDYLPVLQDAGKSYHCVRASASTTALSFELMMIRDGFCFLPITASSMNHVIDIKLLTQ